MPTTHTLEDIRIRDPFVLTVPEESRYVLFGTTDPHPWEGPGVGFDCYESTDLVTWRGPIPAFRPPTGFWATTHFWAPEVHPYRGRYFLFASFAGEGRLRGTQILVADSPTGPYREWSDGPVTPARWQCLDGTLHVDEAGDPWIVYCHEWLQVHDGAMIAQRLSPDLREALGRPHYLFSASEAPWSRPGGPAGASFPSYVTDGPWLHRLTDGALVMLWSSSGEQGYAMGLARSESGTVLGPWRQETEPLWREDGGHGMLTTTLDGRLLLSLHQPNDYPNERTVLREVVERGGTLALA